MKVCFPSQKDAGLESLVYNHFGSAPMFIMVDTTTSAVSKITNEDQHHTHGACNPIKALGSGAVDAVVVGGIGGGALSRLTQIGIKVYRSAGTTVREDLALLSSGQLAEYTPQSCCSGHGQGTGCAH